jgi:hypothetical protein
MIAEVLLVQHVKNGLDLWNLRLKLLPRLLPNTRLSSTTTLPHHERGVAKSELVPNVSYRAGHLLSSIEILHNLAMSVLRRRNTIDQSRSTNLRISRSKVHNQPWNKLRLVRICKRCPRRTRISAVDGDFAGKFLCCLNSRDSRGEFAGPVEKKTLGATVLMSLFHAFLVVAEFLEVRAFLGHAHCEGGGVDAKGCYEGENGRGGVGGGGFEEREEQKREESTRKEVDLDGCQALVSS